jgi:hypothetical protein
MKPIRIETIQITQLGWPMIVAIPPIVSRTPAGTPLEAQNAPRQSSWRCNVAGAAAPADSAWLATINASSKPP